MKIFLSWSGELSKELAQCFYNWLPKVMTNDIELYFSHEDVKMGSRWSFEVSKELDNTDYGLLFIADMNHTCPWLVFEAGALSKKVEN